VSAPRILGPRPRKAPGPVSSGLGRRLDSELKFTKETRQLTRAERLALLLQLLQHQREAPPERVFWYIDELGHKYRL
jgi:hypothetical protein